METPKAFKIEYPEDIHEAGGKTMFEHQHDVSKALNYLMYQKALGEEYTSAVIENMEECLVQIFNLLDEKHIEGKDVIWLINKIHTIATKGIQHVRRNQNDGHKGTIGSGTGSGPTENSEGSVD